MVLLLRAISTNSRGVGRLADVGRGGGGGPCMVDSKTVCTLTTLLCLPLPFSQQCCTTGDCYCRRRSMVGLEQVELNMIGKPL